MNKHIIIFFFFFNDTATTEIYTLSLHDASSDLRPGRSQSRHQRIHCELAAVPRGAILHVQRRSIFSIPETETPEPRKRRRRLVLDFSQRTTPKPIRPCSNRIKTAARPPARRH